MDHRARTVALCDASGFKCYADELVRQWDGAMVLPRFLDTRNPQDFVTGVPDNRPPLITRPEPADVFLSSTVLASDL
jgi:hypothetical protein